MTFCALSGNYLDFYINSEAIHTIYNWYHSRTCTICTILNAERTSNRIGKRTLNMISEFSVILWIKKRVTGYSISSRSRIICELDYIRLYQIEKTVIIVDLRGELQYHCILLCY